MREFAHSLSVAAPPAVVLTAFFDAAALAAWWRVTRSVCTPHPLGDYVLEWEPTGWHDETLGRLGGTFRGTVIDYRPGREFFVADAHWLPPDGDPIGPMALDVHCRALGARTLLDVRQSGWKDNRRWSRYYELLNVSFAGALDELKTYVDARR